MIIYLKRSLITAFVSFKGLDDQVVPIIETDILFGLVFTDYLSVLHLDLLVDAIDECLETLPDSCPSGGTSLIIHDVMTGPEILYLLMTYGTEEGVLLHQVPLVSYQHHHSVHLGMLLNVLVPPSHILERLLVGQVEE